MNTTRRILLGTATTLVVVAACGSGTDTPGHDMPDRGDTGTRTTAPSLSESTSTRPRAVDLDGTAPCGLLTDGQLPTLKIDTAGRPVDSDFYKTTGCSWTVIGAGSHLVPVTVEGISAWTDGKRAGQAETIDPVLDFPAITVTLPSDEGRCDVMVDTSEGQYLVAAFSVLPTYEDRFPAPCDGARKLAEAAMENLLK
ncbi:hypothetical protein ALI22I_01755 [Saccharothrix sp. ALI-22-I]|nr:hypothetical protein ALI22I_07780 [Saccharothrix sp. ALI-22-I]ONI92779.1 hypothetical protein ALI22I_01755 [Saccharothrix sp. ALI-22-I]